MTGLINAIVVLIVLLNLLGLGCGKIGALIRVVAIQGMLLGLLSAAVHEHLGWQALGISVAAIMLKGIAIPRMLGQAMKQVHIQKEVEPIIGLMPSMMLGALGTAISIGFADYLPLTAEHSHSLLVPASLSTVITGFILLTTRLKAISQVLGYLVLENGIFLFGLLLIEAMPFLVEIGVLLDLFVGIFVICIIINHINRQFTSLEEQNLSTLRE